MLWQKKWQIWSGYRSRCKGEEVRHRLRLGLATHTQETFSWLQATTKTAAAATLQHHSHLHNAVFHVDSECHGASNKSKMIRIFVSFFHSGICISKWWLRWLPLFSLNFVGSVLVVWLHDHRSQIAVVRLRDRQNKESLLKWVELDCYLTTAPQWHHDIANCNRRVFQQFRINSLLRPHVIKANKMWCVCVAASNWTFEWNLINQKYRKNCEHCSIDFEENQIKCCLFTVVRAFFSQLVAFNATTLHNCVFSFLSCSVDVKSTLTHLFTQQDTHTQIPRRSQIDIE